MHLQIQIHLDILIRRLWQQTRWRRMSYVQMNSKVSRSLVAEWINPCKASFKNWTMSRAFGLSVCDLWRSWLCDRQRNTNGSSKPHLQRQTGNRCHACSETAGNNSQMAVGVGCHSADQLILVYSSTSKRIKEESGPTGVSAWMYGPYFCIL